jgi:hypothetical protein
MGKQLVNFITCAASRHTSECFSSGGLGVVNVTVGWAGDGKCDHVLGIHLPLILNHRDLLPATKFAPLNFLLLSMYYSFKNDTHDDVSSLTAKSGSHEIFRGKCVSKQFVSRLL